MNSKFDHYAFIINKLNVEEKRWKLAENAFRSIVSSSWNKHINGNELTDKDITEFGHICKQSETYTQHHSTHS